MTLVNLVKIVLYCCITVLFVHLVIHFSTSSSLNVNVIYLRNIVDF